jgi:predicted AAA+ superfamily ATPase
MPKIYFNDIGLRNSLLHNFQLLPHRQDKGNIIENYAFTRFRQKHNILDINFWRTTSGNEIDFVISEMYDQGFAAEIKYNYSQYRKNKFNLFRKNYPNYNIYCFAFESQNPEFEIIRI